MTEDKMADTQREGEITIAETENEDSESSQDKKNEDGKPEAGSGKGEGNQDPDKDKPFHEHPRWKERETEWDTRFNEQETRHQDDLKNLREEFGGARKANAEATKIPSWFGGDQAAWDAYRADRDVELKAAEDRAYDRLTNAKSTETKAIEEATTYMQTELTSIESDKTLNPTGAKIDPNKLLKIVMDNDLVDSKGRWNYRAGFRIYLQGESAAGDKGDRKVIAGATTSESKGESKPAPYKTSADFKRDRPW